MALILQVEDKSPSWGENCFIAPNATLAGDVVMGNDCSVWFNAVLRGDVNSIRIGAYTNIQDLCVVHVFKGTHPTEILDHVTVGHSATLHGCRIESWCLIGMGASVLNGAQVGAESIVAAGALVPEGMQVPPRSLVMGMPAKVRRPLTGEELQDLRRYAQNYYEYKETYLAESGLSR